MRKTKQRTRIRKWQIAFPVCWVRWQLHPSTCERRRPQVFQWGQTTQPLCHGLITFQVITSVRLNEPSDGRRGFQLTRSTLLQQAPMQLERQGQDHILKDVVHLKNKHGSRCKWAPSNPANDIARRKLKSAPVSEPPALTCDRAESPRCSVISSGTVSCSEGWHHGPEKEKAERLVEVVQEKRHQIRWWRGQPCSNGLIWHRTPRTTRPLTRRVGQKSADANSRTSQNTHTEANQTKVLEGTCQTECQKNVFKTACFLRFSVTLFCSNFHSLQALETCLEACFEACSDAFILATLEFETCIEACLQLRSKIQQGSFQLRQVQLCWDSWLFFLGPAPFAFCFASLLNGDAYLAGGSAFSPFVVFFVCVSFVRTEP